jgi:hypothetical protein
VPLLLAALAASSGIVPATGAAQASNPPVAEQAWRIAWRVGFARGKDHPLPAKAIVERLKPWMTRLPAGEFISAPAETLTAFRTNMRQKRIRYALFVDASQPSLVTVVVLDEASLSSLARLELDCKGCDTKAWDARFKEGLRALFDALNPLLENIDKKEEERKAELEAEKRRYSATYSAGFRVLGSGLKLVGVEARLTLASDDKNSAANCQTFSGKKGRIRCENLLPGSYELIATLAGFKPLRRKVSLRKDEVLTERLDLNPSRINPFQITVRSRKPYREVTRVQLSREELEDIPGTGGDVVRAVQSLPGVARAPGLSPLIIIRGAEPDDSLFLIDGFRTGLLFHLTGQSILANETVESLEFIPSNFSARYGRSHGGVVAVKTNEEHTKEWRRRVQTDLYAGSIFSAGPVGKDGMLWLSFRRSWIDAVLPLAAEVLPLDFTVAPRFYDYFAKYDQKIAGFGSVGVVYQGALDKVKFAIDQPPDFDPSVRGDVSALTMFHRIRPYAVFRSGPWRHRSSFNAQLESFDVSFGENFKLSVESRSLEWRHEAKRQLSGGNTLFFGLDPVYESFVVGGRADGRPQEGQGPGSLARGETKDFQEEGSNFRGGGYAEILIKSGLWKSSFGLRLDTDAAQWTVYPQPRMTMRRNFGKSPWDLRWGMGVYSQPPRDDETIKPFGNPDLFWEHAAHGQIGLGFTGSGGVSWETSLFGKRVIDAVGNEQEGSEVAGTAGNNRLANVGSGRTYGLELLLRQRKSTTPFRGFLAYTLSRAERQDRELDPWRLFSYDQTHVLSVVGTYQWTARLATGLRYRYATGNPLTPNLGSILDSRTGTYIPVPGERFSARPPAYWQFDARIDYKILRPGWRVELYLDLQNATNRQNIEQVGYNVDYTQQEFSYGLPVIPSFGVKAVF